MQLNFLLRRLGIEMNKKIKIEKNGPYVVSGNIPLAKEEIANDYKACRLLGKCDGEHLVG